MEDANLQLVDQIHAIDTKMLHHDKIQVAKVYDQSSISWYGDLFRL